MAKPEWLIRFLDDLKRRQFWALKALYFLIFGGMFTLYPFLTIHARSLGITEKEIGAIYGVLPILGLFAPALAGMLADKIGNFKILMSFTFAIGGFSGLIFLAVPQARVTYRIPERVPIALNCSGQGHSVAIAAPYLCNYTLSNAQIEVTHCQLKCPTSGLVVPLHHSEEKWCNLSEECRTHSTDNSENRIQTTQEANYSVDIHATWNHSFENNETLFLLDEEFCPDFQKIYPTISSYNITDSSSYSENNENVSCSLECSGSISRNDFCSNDISIVDINPPLTFAIYLMVRIFNGITLAMSLPLLEGATIAILKEHKGDFGFQRLYINLGMIVMTPISGLLMDTFSSDIYHTDYRPSFFLYCGMNCLSSLAILFVDLKFKKPANNVLKDFASLIIKAEVATFLLVNLISGISLGLIDTFLFWLLDDMGADKSLMGTTVMVGAFFGIPMLIASAPIIEKLGHVNTICLGMAFYVLRLTGYSLMQSPWWAMPFEALECFTVSLLAVACLSYAAVLSSPSTMTSLQGMQAGIVHGVGRGAGSLMGGFLSVSLGIQNTFQMMALICGLTVAVYYTINRCIFEKRRQTNQNAEKKGVKEEDGTKIDKYIDEEKGKHVLNSVENHEKVKPSSGNMKEMNNSPKVNKIDPQIETTENGPKEDSSRLSTEI